MGDDFKLRAKNFPGKLKKITFGRQSFSFLERDELFNVLTQEIFRHHPATHVFLASCYSRKKQNLHWAARSKNQLYFLRKLTLVLSPFEARRCFESKKQGEKDFFISFSDSPIQFDLISGYFW